MNFVPLDKAKHQNLKVKADSSFPFAKKAHSAAVTLMEFPKLSTAMPIVFVKIKPKTEEEQGAEQGDHYRAITMLGFEGNQNLFLSDDKWQAQYVPMNILRYPFDVSQNGDRFSVCIDTDSDLVSETEGQALFDEEDATEFLQKRQAFLSELTNSELMTDDFTKTLQRLDLFEELNLIVSYENDKHRRVTDLFSINEQRLKQLADDDVLELFKKGYLGAIYSVLLSQGQLARMVELSANTENPLKSVQILRASDLEAKKDSDR